MRKLSFLQLQLLSYLLPHPALLAHARPPVYEHVIVDEGDIARARRSVQGPEPVVVVLRERFVQGGARKQDDASFARLQRKKRDHMKNNRSIVRARRLRKRRPAFAKPWRTALVASNLFRDGRDGILNECNEYFPCDFISAAMLEY